MSEKPNPDTVEGMDWRKIFEPHRGDEARTALPTQLITSDTNTEAKTRIPATGVAVLSMTYLDLVSLRAEGKFATLHSMLDYIHASGGFGDRQRTNWISEGGESRREFAMTAIASLWSKIEEFGSAVKERFSEGARGR